MSAWFKRGEKTDCVSAWMQNWSVLDCAQESWQYVTCQVKESGCCLILYCLSSPQGDGNLVWLRDDYISIVCTVCLRNLKVLGSPCGFFLIKNTCRERLSVSCTEIFSLAVYLLTEGKLDVTKDGLRHLTIEPENMFGELALLYNCTHSFTVSGIEATCGCLVFFFLYLHAGITGAQSLGNTGGI